MQPKTVWSATGACLIGMLLLSGCVDASSGTPQPDMSADRVEPDGAEPDTDTTDVAVPLPDEGGTDGALTDGPLPDMGQDAATDATQIPFDGGEPPDEGPAPDGFIDTDAGGCAANLERCNGLDDDCDGRIDETFGVGQACQAGGRCGAGVLECADAMSVRCSSGPAGSEDSSAPEVCNGEDDDCDSRTDEALATICYTGPPASADRGECRFGMVRCVDGGFNGACEGEVTPEPDDSCDGADQDCDGAIDEAFIVGQCGLGVCRAASQPGECANGVGNVCVPGEPSGDDTDCNELDDDCDGAIDEDFGEGLPGACGVGACRRNGLICVDGQPAPCVPGEPTGDDSTCDGVDDDCDGSVDEAYVVVERCSAGVCAAASRPSACNGGVETECEPGLPTGEDSDCDTVDEDCDGTADEGFVVERCGVGECLSGGRPSSCENGVPTPCAPGLPSPTDIVCDGLDSDCDGAVDEDYRVVEQCGRGLCGERSTASRCTGGEERPCEPGAPAPQDATCDGVDDDCDGAVDEAYAPVQCGLGECRSTSACIDGGELLCTPQAALSNVDDLCDGLDEDCDGRVDEEYAVIECGLGICVAASDCQGGTEAVCEPGPANGIDDDCDGLDSDCDGPIDEGVTVLEGGEVRLTDDDAQSVRPSIAQRNGGFAIVWSDNRTGDGLVWFRRITTAGEAVGDDVALTNVGPANLDADIATRGNDFGVVWTSTRDPIPGIYFRRVSADGVPLGIEQRIDNRLGAATNAHIVWTGTNYGVTWMQGPVANRDIWFRQISAAGDPLGEPLQINQTAGTSLVPDIAWSGAEFGIAWTEVEDDDANIWFARVNANGLLIAPPARVIAGEGNANGPSLVSTGVEFGLAWYDTREDTQIYFARLDNRGRLRGEQIAVTHDRRISSLPAISWNGQQFGVAWNDTRDGNFEIYFARVTAAGVAAQPVRISNGVGNSLLPSLAWTGVDYGVVWYDARDGNDEIYFGHGPLGCE